jgi:hypothetical protein
MSYTTRRLSYLYRFDKSNHSIIPTIETLDKGTSILLSTHKLTGFDSVIGRIPRDHYVICLVYFKGDDMKDTQLGTTGSLMKKNPNIPADLEKPPGLPDLMPLYENTEFGAVREVAEEIGIFIDKSSLLNKTHARHPTRRHGQYQDVYTYTVDVSNCMPYSPDAHSSSPELECTGENGWTDNRSKKVQILVHGELTELIEIVEQIKNRIPSNDLDSIKGLRLLHQQDVYLAMKCLNGSYR